MAGSLTQDYDAHIPFSFAHVPASPVWANRTGRVRRWFLIAFGESWLAVLLFRLKQRLRAAGVPIGPSLCDLLSRALFRVSIGNAVEIGPGLMMTHGNVVIDGRTRIGKHCQINPWVTIGLSNSRKLGFSADGPTIGDEVHIGTGAKILGPVTIGDHARIGANAVVVHDVPANSTAVGAPARVVERASGASTGDANADGEVMAQMRQAIVDYKLKRRSRQSLEETLRALLDGRAPSPNAADDLVARELAILEVVDEADKEGVTAALTALEAALNS